MLDFGYNTLHRISFPEGTNAFVKEEIIFAVNAITVPQVVWICHYTLTVILLLDQLTNQ